MLASVEKKVFAVSAVAVAEESVVCPVTVNPPVVEALAKIDCPSA
jgi:hypothetical protein